MGRAAAAAILDIDGTVVDSTYHQALAWHRAFHRLQVPVPIWRVHRAIGMGGDRLVTEVAGAAVERGKGDELRSAWAEEWKRVAIEVEPFDDVRDTVLGLRDLGWSIGVATSGPEDNARTALELADITDLVDALVSADDIDHSKPDPQMLTKALSACGAQRGLCVGDSVYDAQASARLGMPCIGVRTGGFSEAELREAGATLVLTAIGELRSHLDDPLLSPET